MKTIQADLKKICEAMVNMSSDSYAAAVVDLSEGNTQGLIICCALREEVMRHFNEPYLRAVAAAAVSQFCGETTSTIEHMLGLQRGKTEFGLIETIYMATRQTKHYMTVVPIYENDARVRVLLVYVTGKQGLHSMGELVLMKHTKPVAAVLRANGYGLSVTL